MTPAGTVADFRSYLRRFARDREAVSAVEFAIVLPFMVLLYVGSAELGDGLAIKSKVTEAARTVADLASQYVSIDGTTMSNVLGASSEVVAPYASSSMVVTVSEVSPTNASGQGTITWSCSLNGTARTVGSSVTLPTKLQTPSNESVLWGEVTYPYTPSMGYVITGTIKIYESIFFYPRLSNSVTLSSCS
ncbi:MAG: TadE/TadG family type IV pilus assembly protein [Xanthobacteraceae bacterium]